MGRGLSLATRYAIDADNPSIFMVHLVELVLDEPTGAIRLTDAGQDIEWSGNTFTRGGNLLGFSDIEENAALLVTQVTVSLAGVDQSLVALVLQENYLDRDLIIYRGLLNVDTREVDAVETLFEGRVNQPAVSEDPDVGASTVALTASSSWVDFERTPGRRTNHEQQQSYFPGDKGFEFASQTFRDLPWGQAK